MFACVTPAYREASDAAALGDGSAPRVQDAAPTSVDGTVTQDGGPDSATRPIPAWAEAAQGTYAVRQRFFGRGMGITSGINELSSEWHWLSTVRFDPQSGQLHMSARLCDAQGTNSLGGVLVNVVVRYPDQLPNHEWDIEQTDGAWRTHSNPATRYGFERDALVACPTAGAQVACADEQKTWLASGQCTCAADRTLLPSTVEDCRIDDDDQDGAPGYTVLATGGIHQTYFVRTLDMSEMFKGTFGSDGALASAGYAQSVDTLQIGCNPEPCVHADSTPCDASLNPVQLKRIATLEQASSLTCADVLMQSNAWFGADDLTFPEGQGC